MPSLEAPVGRSSAGRRASFQDPGKTGDALPDSTRPPIQLLAYAQPPLGRDRGTAKTGLKWVVSAARRKYLASVARGNINAADQTDEPTLARTDGRSEILLLIISSRAVRSRFSTYRSDLLRVPRGSGVRSHRGLQRSESPSPSQASPSPPGLGVRRDGVAGEALRRLALLCTIRARRFGEGTVPDSALQVPLSRTTSDPCSSHGNG